MTLDEVLIRKEQLILKCGPMSIDFDPRVLGRYTLLSTCCNARLVLEADLTWYCLQCEKCLYPIGNFHPEFFFGVREWTIETWLPFFTDPLTSILWEQDILEIFELISLEAEKMRNGPSGATFYIARRLRKIFQVETIGA